MPPVLHADDTAAEAFSSFADPSRIWGNGVESAIEEAYRQCFRTFIIGERVMNLRLPFAQNYERAELAEQPWEFVGGGKAGPAFLWEAITEILESDGFREYAKTLQDGREKVVIFDIPERTWTTSRDIFDIARMKAGSYRGLPHRPYVLNQGNEITQSDVYNYLYCVGWVGLDCSGFVWHVLSYTARKGGLDLGRALRTALGAPRNADPAYYAGTAFFNSRSPEIIAVTDRVGNLRPGDVLLFRGEDGSMVHSAVIQSVDRDQGIIRYVQCTDEAPLSERGAHESYIYFDPSSPDMSLKDESIRWTQKRYPPFPGEKASPFSDDGKRYRAFPEHGGGRVVRLRAMEGPIRNLSARR
ncbi:peptidoglycan endopeptidase [Breznakiella homolactica]|uniref:C40 family peptidase n=1 Tax=Breznakiella homolactica TaxID=2798577 RepID=A0A7T7XQR8_9SPIR|nr:peptidoglycan endopeptidase [Breznakiella homolactica]QQO10765.1 peptidoglycan endopeptidase [Breznakiella homolactica]